jgi:radical SAM superfamily enzyme YgiQ (UPF0313 family)
VGHLKIAAHAKNPLAAMTHADILLCSINAKYIHANLGLRYLRANLGELHGRSLIAEYTIEQSADEIVEDVIRHQPKIVGFGVYIWNLLETQKVVQRLKLLVPELKIILGGPEISHESENEPIVTWADHILKGEADLEFKKVCLSILSNETPQKWIACTPPPLEQVQLPYGEYSDSDLQHRLIYVEASRGCPFQCEFCLSSLDEKVRSFDTPLFLEAMRLILVKGCKTFKFVDRTFNLKPQQAIAIIEHFKQHWREGVFLHFEMVPDRLPEVIREQLPWFPKGSLQFEIGIQSFTPEVGQRISRRMDIEKTRDNFAFIRQHTHIHTHADLIIGLPGENLNSLASSFDLLWEMDPDEIQIGILKKLKGTPIARHSREFGMIFSPDPAYEILANKDFDFFQMNELKRFARHFEIFVNGGRFPRSIRIIASAGRQGPFANFLQFSRWLWAQTGQTHAIKLRRQIELLHEFATAVLGLNEEAFIQKLVDDLCDPHCNPEASRKGLPNFLHSAVAYRMRKDQGPFDQTPQELPTCSTVQI